MIEIGGVNWDNVPVPEGRDVKSIKNMYYMEKKKLGMDSKSKTSEASPAATPGKSRGKKNGGPATPKTPKTPEMASKTASKRKVNEMKQEL